MRNDEPNEVKQRAGKIGARQRWGKSRGETKQIRVRPETAERVRTELPERDRLSILSQIIDEGLDRIKDRSQA